MGEGNKPEKKFRAGGITATVWKNTGKKDGKEFEFHTISVERNYKDGDDWKTTNSMRVGDLPKLALVANKAFSYLMIAKQE